MCFGAASVWHEYRIYLCGVVEMSENYINFVERYLKYTFIRMRNCLLTCCLVAVAVAGAHTRSDVLTLHDGWEFRRVGETEWLPAYVPGTVHQDLLAHDLLPDPFWGTNEAQVQWVELEDWAYRTVFDVTQEQLSHDAALLTFGGLDTFADIYLNGVRLATTDNMFLSYTFDAKSLLQTGANRLEVVFRSPIQKTLPQWETNGFDYPADNDMGTPHLSVFSRKAQYSYGWDWGFRMVTCGIWRPVSLAFCDAARITDYWVRQLSVGADEAQVLNCIELESLTSEEQTADITITCSYRGGETFTASQQIALPMGSHSLTIPMIIPHPHLWMPNGWGEQALYDFTLQVRTGDSIVATKAERIGLRTVELVREPDDAGESFYFRVNGEPLFAKGANFIPADALLPRITADRYQQLFRDMKDANMNMVRVWGGGIYEDDTFYRLADESGILVWQDFMFACTSYPSDTAFLSNVGREAEYNIKRLRNHACLALWCGNNEVFEAMRYWGWRQRYADTPSVYQQMQDGYDKLFRQLLPSLVDTLCPGTAYIHSSPESSNWGRPESWATGDTHNWGIWHGRKPFETLDSEVPRFMSEYGFQSFPEMKTIATFASPADYALESDVMNAHQKSSIGNALIRETMEHYYHVPATFEGLVYVGQLLQGMGVRRGVEAHRRGRPYCMGTLYWQLDDCWPVVSWSSIDYYGNWKALHYQMRRAFAPLLLSVERYGDDLRLYVVSDELREHSNTTLQLRLMDFNGKQLRTRQLNGDVSANASTLYATQPYADWATQPRNSFLLLTLKDSKGHTLCEQVYYFNYARDLDLPRADIRCSTKQSDGTCELTLTARQLARDVFVETPLQGAQFSDNFFDILPGQTRRITITSPHIKSGEPISISLHQLAETTE